MFMLDARLRFDPAKRDEALAAAARMQQASAGDKGVIDVRYFPDPVDPAVIQFYEIWQSDEDLAAHDEQPHIAAFHDALVATGFSGMKVRRYEISSMQDVAPPPGARTAA